MTYRQPANSKALPLLKLLEQRFDLRLPTGSAAHLRRVYEHYLIKRRMLLWQHGEAGALACESYAKAVLVSETARVLLREFDPWPRRKQKGITR